MPLYMDMHKNAKGITKEALEGAHKKDLEVQDKHGVKFQSYWYNEKEEKVFCLVDAPDKEAANAVHKDSHGMVADEILEVQAGA